MNNKQKVWRLVNKKGSISNYTNQRNKLEQRINIPLYNWDYQGMNYEEVKYDKLYNMVGLETFFNVVGIFDRRGTVGAATILGFDLQKLTQTSFIRVKVRGSYCLIKFAKDLPGFNDIGYLEVQKQYAFWENPSHPDGGVNMYPFVEGEKVRWLANYNKWNNTNDEDSKLWVIDVENGNVIKYQSVYENGVEKYSTAIYVDATTTTPLHKFITFKQINIKTLGDNNETTTNINFNTVDARQGQIATEKKLSSKSQTLKLELLGCDIEMQKLALSHFRDIAAYSQMTEGETKLFVANSMQDSELTENEFLAQDVIIKSIKETGLTNTQQNFVVEIEVFTPVDVWELGEEIINIDEGKLEHTPHTDEMSNWVLLTKSNIRTIYGNPNLTEVRSYLPDGTLEWIRYNQAPSGTNPVILGSQELANGEFKTFLRDTKRGNGPLRLIYYDNNGNLQDIDMINTQTQQSNSPFQGVYYRPNVKFGNSTSTKFNFCFLYNNRVVGHVMFNNAEIKNYFYRQYVNTSNLGFQPLYVEPYFNNDGQYILFTLQLDNQLRTLRVYTQAPSGNAATPSQKFVAEVLFSGSLNPLNYIRTKTGISTTTEGWGGVATFKGDNLILVHPNYENNDLILIKRFNIPRSFFQSINTPSAISITASTTLTSISGLFADNSQNFSVFNTLIPEDTQYLTNIENIYFGQDSITISGDYLYIPSSIQGGTYNFLRFNLTTPINNYAYSTTSGDDNNVIKGKYSYLMPCTSNNSMSVNYLTGWATKTLWTNDNFKYTYVADIRGYYPFTWNNKGEVSPKIYIQLDSFLHDSEIWFNDSRIMFDKQGKDVTLYFDYHEQVDIYYTNFVDGFQGYRTNASDVLNISSNLDVNVRPGKNSIIFKHCVGKVIFIPGKK